MADVIIYKYWEVCVRATTNMLPLTMLSSQSRVISPVEVS